jgi:hypothetical protein
MKACALDETKTANAQGNPHARTGGISETARFYLLVGRSLVDLAFQVD